MGTIAEDNGGFHVKRLTSHDGINEMEITIFEDLSFVDPPSKVD